MEIRVTETDVGTFAGHETTGNMDGYGSIARFGRPIGVAINPSGRIFVSDASFNAVRTIDSVTALSATIGQQESSTHLPSVLAVSNNGRDLFVVDWAVDADVGGARIQHLQLTDDSQNLTSFRTLAGSLHGVQGHQDGNGVQTLFHGIQGIALSEQNSALVVYVSCSQTHSIRRVDVTTGQVSTLLGSGDINVFGHADGSGVQALFHHPWSIAISSDGNNLYISEEMSTNIRHVQLSREDLGSVIPLMVNTIQAITQDGTMHSFHARVVLSMSFDLNTLWIGDNFTVYAMSLQSRRLIAKYGNGIKAHEDGMSRSCSFMGFSQLAVASDGDALFAVYDASPTIRYVFTGRAYTPQSFYPPSGRYFVTSTAVR
jgi:DNA-binding beta-propeller fold protein YncE